MPIPRSCVIAFLCVCTVGLQLVHAEPAATQPFKPTSEYVQREIRGWTVLVNGDLLSRDPPLSAACLDLLDAKLLDVERAVPPRALAKLKPVHIWLELHDPRFPGGAYHPSRQWLIENGFNPDKAKSVELGNARNFLSWSKEQPMMVLHELAHAYHDQVLGYDDPDIAAAYEAAKHDGLYEHVLRSNGHIERAYALNNDQEYFAELSEAFFGTNDFFPFVRAEIGQHDPRMLKVLKDKWNRD
ncbi:MAG TPA: hypothetical protein VLI90_06115 [Tepidisphaeraceae bacterium]|nr:hypothetical protein [Tepidisphaeraceae bacterium]